MSHCPECAKLESELSAEREAHKKTNAALDAALELIREYEAQWGGENLAKKWGLKEEREAIEAKAYPPSPPPAEVCGTCSGIGEVQRVTYGDSYGIPCPDCKGTGRAPTEETAGKDGR